MSEMKEYILKRNINIIFIFFIILTFLLNQKELGIYGIIAYGIYSTYSALCVFGIIKIKKKGISRKLSRKPI